MNEQTEREKDNHDFVGSFGGPTIKVTSNFPEFI